MKMATLRALNLKLKLLADEGAQSTLTKTFFIKKLIFGCIMVGHLT